MTLQSPWGSRVGPLQSRPKTSRKERKERQEDLFLRPTQPGQGRRPKVESSVSRATLRPLMRLNTTTVPMTNKAR